MRGTIRRGNRQKKSKKIMDGHFSDVHRIPRNKKNRLICCPDHYNQNLDHLFHALTKVIVWF